MLVVAAIVGMSLFCSCDTRRNQKDYSNIEIPKDFGKFRDAGGGNVNRVGIVEAGTGKVYCPEDKTAFYQKNSSGHFRFVVGDEEIFPYGNEYQSAEWAHDKIVLKRGDFYDLYNLKGRKLLDGVKDFKVLRSDDPKNKKVFFFYREDVYGFGYSSVLTTSATEHLNEAWIDENEVLYIGDFLLIKENNGLSSWHKLYSTIVDGFLCVYPSMKYIEGTYPPLFSTGKDIVDCFGEYTDDENYPYSVEYRLVEPNVVEYTKHFFRKTKHYKIRVNPKNGTVTHIN